MEEREAITIFHLYRRDGNAIFLHPFLSPDRCFEILERGEVKGLYGREPRVESLTLLRKRSLPHGGRQRQLLDRREAFRPRFICSAVVFVVAYLFFGFVVHDPLPFLDDNSSSASVRPSSPTCHPQEEQEVQRRTRKRVELRTKVDRILFEEHPFVKRVEELLNRNAAESPEALLGDPRLSMDGFIAPDEEDLARQLLSYLEKRFSGKEFRRQEKRLKGLSGKSDAKEVETIVKWAENRQVDLNLFAFYARIKEESRNSR
jgi:hypothetical protein